MLVVLIDAGTVGSQIDATLATCIEVMLIDCIGNPSERPMVDPRWREHSQIDREVAPLAGGSSQHVVPAFFARNRSRANRGTSSCRRRLPSVRSRPVALIGADLELLAIQRYETKRKLPVQYASRPLGVAFRLRPCRMGYYGVASAPSM